MRYFHYLLSLCLLTNCATLNRVRSINILDKAQLKSEQIYAVIPYESVSKLQVIKVFIEGKDYRFIFDTGGYTVLSQDLIETIRGKERKSYIDVKDGNNVADRIETYVLEELRIGDQVWKDVGFAKIGFTESEWFQCLGLSGTIGPNVMKECLWYYDDPAGQLTITDDANRLPEMRDAIDLSLETDNVHKPSLRFTATGYAGRLGFDTGFNGLVQLIDRPEWTDRPYLTKIGHRANAGNSTAPTATYRLYQFDSLNVGGLELRNFIATARNNASSDLLGSDIFTYYRAVLDLQGKQLRLSPIPEKHPPSTYESYGCGFDYRDGHFVIGDVLLEGPAAMAGLQAGDRITAVNGQRWTFTDYCDFIDRFRIPNTDQVVLDLLKAGVSRRVKLSRATYFAKQ